MIVLLLILIPLLGGSIAFFLKDDKGVRGWALVAAIATLAVSLFALTTKNVSHTNYSTAWMGSLGSRFSLSLDGLSAILCLLTAVAYPIIFIATWRTHYKKSHNFFGLMLLAQAGLMGVFLATDALLFYFFW